MSDHRRRAWSLGSSSRSTAGAGWPGLRRMVVAVRHAYERRGWSFGVARISADGASSTVLEDHGGGYLEGKTVLI